MVAPRDFAAALKVATAGLESQAIAPLLAQAARQTLAEVQAEGIAPQNYIRAVNGHVGASEDEVIPPGPIFYQFNWLPEIAEYALGFAEARSPVKSGRFKNSWFAMVNGSLMQGGFGTIPVDAELIVTNDQPYARKIEVGHMKMSVPPGVVQDTRQAVMRRFGNVVNASVKFISLEGAYTLRTKSGRKDRKAGHQLTYPALLVTQRL